MISVDRWISWYKNHHLASLTGIEYDERALNLFMKGQGNFILHRLNSFLHYLQVYCHIRVRYMQRFSIRVDTLLCKSCLMCTICSLLSVMCSNETMNINFTVIVYSLRVRCTFKLCLAYTIAPIYSYISIYPEVILCLNTNLTML